MIVVFSLHKDISKTNQINKDIHTICRDSEAATHTHTFTKPNQTEGKYIIFPLGNISKIFAGEGNAFVPSLDLQKITDLIST